MTNNQHSRAERSILVYLPTRPATAIVSRLVGHGYAATAVSTAPELYEALGSGSYFLAVTRTREIEMTRRIRAILVVNIEIFLHTTTPGRDVSAPSPLFDDEAFLKRIKTLTERRPSSQDAVRSNLASAPIGKPSGIHIRLWSAAKLFFAGSRHMPATSGLE